MFRKYQQHWLSESRLHWDKMHNDVTKDYRKLCGEEALQYHIVARWVCAFQCAREPPSLSQQLTNSTLCMRTLLDTHQHWTCTKLSSEFGITLSTIHKILMQNLKMWRIYVHCMPLNLTEIHMATYGTYQTAFESL